MEWSIQHNARPRIPRRLDDDRPGYLPFFPRGVHARRKAHPPASVIGSRPNYADPGVNDDYASLVWQFRRQSEGGGREKNWKKARK